MKVSGSFNFERDEHRSIWGLKPFSENKFSSNGICIAMPAEKLQMAQYLVGSKPRALLACTRRANGNMLNLAGWEQDSRC